MSASEAKLTVDAADLTAKITVLDANYARVRWALGRLEATLPAGLYKLRVRVGSATQEQLIELGDTRRSAHPDLCLSPLPSRSRERRAPTTPTARSPRSSAAVAATDWATAPRFSSSRASLKTGASTPAHNPAAGLSLHAPDGRMLANIEANATVAERRAGWRADVAPGAYRLRLERRDGFALERALIVSAGQQAQVFLWPVEQRLADATTQRLADLAQASLHISSIEGFNPEDDDMRVAELLAYALVQTREALSDRLLERLRKDPINPMLGLLGAHLMLREQKGPSPEFDALVDRLSALFGPSHPDICALRLKQTVKPADAQEIVRMPPLLRESWEIAVEASVTRPEVIALDPPWRLAAQRMISTGPWLSWRDAADAGEEDARSDAILHAVGEYMRARGELHAQIVAKSAGFASKLKNAFASVRSLLPAAIGGKPLAPPGWLHPLGEQEKIELARSLGVPGDVLDAILSKGPR